MSCKNCGYCGYPEEHVCTNPWGYLIVNNTVPISVAEYQRLKALDVLAVPPAQGTQTEVWVTAEELEIPIGSMTEVHAKNALAMVVRNLKAGMSVSIEPNGKLVFLDRPAQGTQAVPDGFAFLPNTLLPEMEDAMEKAQLRHIIKDSRCGGHDPELSYKALYRAAISAAPKFTGG